MHMLYGALHTLKRRIVKDFRIPKTCPLISFEWGKISDCLTIGRRESILLTIGEKVTDNLDQVCLNNQIILQA